MEMKGMEMETPELESAFRKFRETGQEKLRLETALEYFEKETDPQRTGEYEAYLKRRIRPAMEQLIITEDVEKMELLHEKGMFGQKELEVFTDMAEREKKPASLVWLLQLKNRKYGFKQKNFQL